MADKKQGREIAFVETYEETAKKTIEKAFLKHGVSYLTRLYNFINDTLAVESTVLGH